MTEPRSTQPSAFPPPASVLIGWLVLIGAVIWTYRPAMAFLIGSWWQEADYGHCFFVPVFAVFLLWYRGGMIDPAGRRDFFENANRALFLGGPVGAALGCYLAVAQGGNPLWVTILVTAALGFGVGAGLFQMLFQIVGMFVSRRRADRRPADGSWSALAFLAAAAAMVIAGTYLHIVRLAPLSLLPCIAGLTLLIGGWRAMHWAWPSVAFLVFMVPLPGFLDVAFRYWLQQMGTLASVFAIQTLGIPAVAQGNVIQLTEGQLGVVEACSGLRMLMLFFAICLGAAFVLRRPLWEKAVIVLSAVPIAVFANVSRITVTAVLYEAARKWPTVISADAADWVFHKGAGWLMMPLGILLLWGEMVLLSKLLVEPVEQHSLSVSLAGGSNGSPEAS